MRHPILFVICILYCIPLLSQKGDLRGRILERGSLEPVAFATVYINGTTKGTVTDDLGQYELKDVVFPAELVVSHLSYESEVLALNAPTDKGLVFHITPRAFELKDIEVEDIDQRQKNVKEFEQLFLGIDPVGERASLENSEVLLFERDYRKLRPLDGVVSLQIEGLDKTVPVKYRELPTNLKVRAKAPIIVDQPELGYTIHVDLESFLSTYPTPSNRLAGTSWLGYYYFEQHE